MRAQTLQPRVEVGIKMKKKRKINRNEKVNEGRISYE
jgi:hypothetical protein